MADEAKETTDLTTVERDFSTTMDILDGTQVMINKRIVIVPGKKRGFNRLVIVADVEVPIFTETKAKEAREKDKSPDNEFKALPVTLTQNNPTVYIGREFAATFLKRDGKSTSWLIQSTESIQRFDLSAETKPEIVLRGLSIKAKTGKTE